MMPAPMPVPILTTTTFAWPGSDAGPPLPERQDVDVVVDPDGAPIAGREPLADRVAVPARHDRRRDRPAGLEFDRARDADTDPPQLPGQSLRRPDERVEQHVDPGEADLRTGLDVGGLVVMTEDPAVERRHRDVDARRAEVGDEDVAAVGAEGELAWRPAAGARPDVALGHEPALDELADPLGHDRPAETGPRDQLGTRARPSEADLIEHDDERVERLVRERREPARSLRCDVDTPR